MLQAIDPDCDETITLEFDGKTIKARPGMTIASALLAAGIADCRDTPALGTPRGPYCMMGGLF